MKKIILFIILFFTFFNLISLGNYSYYFENNLFIINITSNEINNNINKKNIKKKNNSNYNNKYKNNSYNNKNTNINSDIYLDVEYGLYVEIE